MKRKYSQMTRSRSPYPLRSRGAIAAAASLIGRKFRKAGKSGRRLSVSKRVQFKQRSGFGMTKRRKSKTTTSSIDHSGIRSSKYRIVLSRKPSPKYMLGYLNYNQQNSLGVTCLSGQQTFFNMSNDLSIMQLGTDSIVNQDPAPHQYYQGLLGMLPNIRSTGDAGNVLIGSNALRLGARLFVKSITYEIQVSNESTTPCTFILYALTPKKGTNVNGWQTGEAFNLLAGGALFDVPNIIASEMTGVADATQATRASETNTAGVIGKPTLSTYGFTPFQLKGFRAIYKGLLKKEINLAPSSMQKIRLEIAVNKIFDHDYIRTAFLGGAYTVPFATIQLLGCLKGTPVMVKSPVAGIVYTANQAATTSRNELAITFNRNIRGGLVQGGAAKTELSMNTFRTVTGTATLEQIDAEDTQIPSIIVT